MKPVHRKIVIFVFSGLIIFLLLGGYIFLEIQKYHDNNSWAEFRIVGDGIDEGSIYKCYPNVNVTELSQTKLYGKGETIDLEFAKFSIKRVDIGKTKGVRIISDSAFIYNGDIIHDVYLVRGENCEIQSNGKSARIELVSIGYR